MPREPEERDAAETATVIAAILGVLFTVVALVFFGGRAAASVLVGAVIAIANLVMLRAIIRAILRPPADDDGKEPEGGGAAWGIVAILKFVVLFGAVGLLLTKGLVDPIPLVVGYGVLPLGITGTALLDSLAPRSRRRR